MGFLATPKARSARSLASASTPASQHRIQHTIGMQLRRFVEEAVFVKGYDARDNQWDIQRIAVEGA